MKTSLAKLLLILSIIPAGRPKDVFADAYITTPGEPMKYLNSYPDGYTLYDLGGRGNITVQRLDGESTSIRDDETGTTTFIRTDGRTRIDPVLKGTEDLDLVIEGLD